MFCLGHQEEQNQTFPNCRDDYQGSIVRSIVIVTNKNTNVNKIKRKVT